MGDFARSQHLGCDTLQAIEYGVPWFGSLRLFAASITI